MKKLVKKMVAASVLAMVASTALAEVDSYLYWMVADNVVYWNGVNVGRTVKDVNGEYAYASVKYSGTDTYLTWYTAAGTTADNYTKMGVNASGGTQAAYWGIDRDIGTSLVFELYSMSGGQSELIGWLDWDSGVPLAALAPYISTTLEGTSGETPFVISGVVPEPTSGLLSLFGLAVLALRRKKSRA